ncbi:MAG TPA: pitrilysin family protein [Candidatus Baltobacteraceae bacterium]|jgi:zinc protease|nr:pitrilysin family protein [Candidatus Baltobacteraceae bacterium]
MRNGEKKKAAPLVASKRSARSARAATGRATPTRRTAAGSLSEIPAMPPGTRLTTLDNGLVIITREDHSAPVVSAQAWCQTGSISEGKWLGAGLSHVLEHMLFKGTTTRPGSRIDHEVQAAGGYMNAYTSFDRTVYHINVPNTGASLAIDILCDIMQNATLPAEEMEKELDVIRREMDMNQDDPGRRAGRRLFECAFTKSPYRFTIIGYPDIFNTLKPADIVAYYRDRYVPNNLFFVVTGDMKSDEVVEQIRRAFAQSKSKALQPLVLPAEPRQTSPREVIEEAPIELCYFHYAWHIPDIRHPDAPALDILASLLGSGRSSRLFREVREKKGLVTSADAWTYSPGEQGLFGVSAATSGDKFDAARQALLLEVERVKDHAVPAQEVSKVIKQFLAATLSTRKTMQGQAQDMGGSWMAANDLNFSERYLAAARGVTPATLQRVARAYLTPANRTLYALLPEGAAPKSSETLQVSAESTVVKIDFPNGLRLLVKEGHRLPFVEMRAVFQGGVLAESAQNNGLTQLVAKMLLQGTRRRSAEQIAVAVESVGGSIESFGGNNSFGVNAEVLSSDFKTAFDVFADVLLNPSFPAAAFERERGIQLDLIGAQRDHLLQSCSQAMRKELFGATGYGLDPLGTESSVGSLGIADVAAFYKKMAVPGNCVLAIFGDVHTADLKALVNKAFGRWKAGAVEFPPRIPASALTKIKRVIDARDKKQAVLVLGFPGLTLKDPDRFALELLQEGCSDLGSRLFLRVREKLGLAYYVGAQHFPGLAPGYFAFYAGTAPEKVEEVERELFKEAALLRTEGFTAEELARCKAKVIGQKKIARQDLGGLALTMALDELYGAGYQNIDTEDALYEGVTLEAIKDVARKYLTPDRAVVSVIRPAV